MLSRILWVLAVFLVGMHDACLAAARFIRRSVRRILKRRNGTGPETQ